MHQYLCDQIKKLSKLQREFLIDHVDGMRPYCNQPVENHTRTSLLFRGLIEYKPKRINSKPTATVLTDDGREALSFVLGDMADELIRAIHARKLPEKSEASIFRALLDCVPHWRSNERRQHDENYDLNKPEKGNDGSTGARLDRQT